MDLLYSKYSNPLEFMRLYIDNGRFGEFTDEIIRAESKRKGEQAEKELDERLWLAYIHSGSEKSFGDWKQDVLVPVSQTCAGTPRKRDDDMTKADIDKLLTRLFPA